MTDKRRFKRCPHCEGYHIDGTIGSSANCNLNECSCSNGDSFGSDVQWECSGYGPEKQCVDQHKCSENGAEICEACNVDDGYFLNVNDLNVQFQTKSYETLYNDGLASLDDKIYGYDWSETFNGENHIEIYSAICSIRTCSCINGSAVVGVECPFHGEIQCDSCEIGHHLFETDGTKTCEINECGCSNGDGFKGTECPEHGVDFCETCDPGHSLENAHQSKYILSVNFFAFNTKYVLQ